MSDPEYDFETQEPEAPRAAVAAIESSVVDPASTDTVDYAETGKPPLAVVNDLSDFRRHMSDATPVITYDPIEAEEVQARYLMGKELGSGAIGQVIAAQDQHLSRDVALKVLLAGPGVSKERLARFVAEAQITAQLEHPTIVPVHEIGQMPGGMPYFAMKQVRGASLGDIINEMRVATSDPQERRRTVSWLLRRFSRVCEGVAYAHSKGVVHRDLKPANIMTGEYGAVHIMDWGLAKVLKETFAPEGDSVRTIRDAPDLGTMDGAIAGTPAYMSPEQARGEKVDHRSDIYSLGLILAEIATQMRVFRDSTGARDTLSQVRTAQAVDLYQLAPNQEIPYELAAIVHKATQPDPARRYQDASDLADDVRAYLEHRELSILPETSHRKLLKWGRRNPLWFGFTAGAVAAALLTAAALVLIQSLMR